MRRYTWKTFSRELTVLAFAALWLVPFYFLLLISFKSGSDIFSSPFKPPADPSTDAYRQAWKGTPDQSFPQGLWSSLIITGGSVLGLIAIGSVTAYVLARRPGRLSNTLFVL